MSYSALAQAYMPAHDNNHYGLRADKISEIILHHMVAIWTAKRCAESFQDASRRASVNYCVGNIGDIVCSLDEDYAAASCGSKAADERGVSIEISNSIMAEPWTVSNATLTSVIKLVADIAKRNGLCRLVPGKNLTWHSMYAPTVCPGDYLRSKMQYIAEQANRINGYGDLPFRLLDGVNCGRGADKLIRYTRSGKTGTNKWGTEIRIDKYGRVLDAPKYGSCNLTAPDGGCVLSGHNLAGNWMLENIKKGYTIAFEDGGVSVIPTGKGYIAGENVPRSADMLVLFKGKASTGTNVWGKEIVCDKNGKVTKILPWGKGNTAIPAGGFVLSGHGKGADVLYKIKVGMTVKISNRKVIYK